MGECWTQCIFYRENQSMNGVAVSTQIAFLSCTKICELSYTDIIHRVPMGPWNPCKFFNEEKIRLDFLDFILFLLIFYFVFCLLFWAHIHYFILLSVLLFHQCNFLSAANFWYKEKKKFSVISEISVFCT